MFPAPLLLTLLILVSPFYLIFDGIITVGVVAAATAVLVAIVGLRIRPGEAEFLSSIIRPIAIVAVIPVLVIIVQLIPLGGTGLANPIWQSAAGTLSRKAIGTITVDPGATLIALARYLSIGALAFVASVIGVDRGRAQWLLAVLTIVSTASAVLILLKEFIDVTLLQDGAPLTAATDCAGLGVILAIAMTLNIRGREKMSSTGRKSLWTRLVFLLCLAAIATCSMAVLVSASIEAYFAVVCGIAAYVISFVMRRFSLDAWGYSAIVAIAVLSVIAVLALRPSDRMGDVTVAFANSPRAPIVGLTQRILAETRWLGTGAGTYASILPIYSDIDELAAGDTPPTAAAAIAIEMGKPFLWASMLAGIALIVTLLRGAARRGRDAYYSAAGAGCVMATIILSLNNDGILNTSFLVVVAATLGMAIGQSKSCSV